MAPPPPTMTDPPVEDPPSVPVLEESKSEEVIPCGICLFEDDRERNEAKMPCCYTEGSSIWYCSPCMKLLCDRSPGGVARCPTCSKNVKWTASGPVTPQPNEIMRKCRMCCQQRIIFRNNLCSACDLGSRNPLRYICDRCGQTQRIPHPMWRYQEAGPEAFGGATWACHQRCGDYTHWRVHPRDAARVPVDDAPASWGLRERLLEDVRATRRATRREGLGGEEARRGGGAPSRCAVS